MELRGAVAPLSNKRHIVLRGECGSRGRGSCGPHLPPRLPFQSTVHTSGCWDAAYTGANSSLRQSKAMSRAQEKRFYPTKKVTLETSKFLSIPKRILFRILLACAPLMQGVGVATFFRPRPPVRPPPPCACVSYATLVDGVLICKYHHLPQPDTTPIPGIATPHVCFSFKFFKRTFCKSKKIIGTIFKIIGTCCKKKHRVALEHASVM